MSNLNISLDMGRVQSSVQGAIRPAVEAALAAIDIKQAIADALTKPLSSRDDYMSLMLGRHQQPRSLLDTMIVEGITEIAKHYVQSHLTTVRPDIEEAFRKMMAGSTNRLVKSFAAATERALAEDWGFELKVEVAHTTPERSTDD